MNRINKKAAIIIFVMIITFVFCFTGCSSESGNSKTIQLDTYNFENYVSLTCRATGSSSTYSDGKYDGV